MIVDEKATKIARLRHEIGEQSLRDALSKGHGAYFMFAARNRPNTVPTRLRAGCPPWRTPEMKAKHLSRKRFKRARRQNRR